VVIPEAIGKIAQVAETPSVETTMNFLRESSEQHFSLLLGSSGIGLIFFVHREKDLLKGFGQ
jgi:hypothetical protein